MKYIFILVSSMMLNSMLWAQKVLDVGMYNQHLEFIEEGWKLIRQEKFEAASDQFEKAIEINRGNADAYVGAATAYMHLGEYELAKTRADTAVGLTSNQSDIYFLTGNIAFNSGDYKRAVFAYTFAINNNKSSEVKIDLANGYFNRGNAYLALEEYEKAIGDYNKTLVTKPDFASAYHNRGIAYKNLSETQSACRDFHAAQYFGSTLSEKYLDECEAVDFSPFNYEEIEDRVRMSSMVDAKKIVDYSDTSLVDTLYYGPDWNLTNKEFGTYYRVATVNTKELAFQGDFTDYFSNGQPLLEGSYDQEGKKTGLFQRFYASGSIYSAGNYVDDKPKGDWEYFHENGEVSEVIRFLNDDYYVVNSWDENGKSGVVNGSGKWKKVISEQDGIKYILIAHFKNKKKVKNWLIRTDDGVLIQKEVYKDGEFVKAIRNNMFSFEPAAQMMSVKMFYSQALPIIESFECSDQIDVYDYPYIKGLQSDFYASSTSQSHGVNSSVNEPTYDGGMMAFYRFVADNLKYPQKARNNGTAGKVIVRFTIQKDGSVSNISCLSNLGDGLEEEAMRLISMTNQWIPAKENDQPVVKALTLPITFRLSN